MPNAAKPGLISSTGLIKNQSDTATHHQRDSHASRISVSGDPAYSAFITNKLKIPKKKENPILHFFFPNRNNGFVKRNKIRSIYQERGNDSYMKNLCEKPGLEKIEEKVAYDENMPFQRPRVFRKKKEENLDEPNPEIIEIELEHQDSIETSTEYATPPESPSKTPYSPKYTKSPKSLKKWSQNSSFEDKNRELNTLVEEEEGFEKSEDETFLEIKQNLDQKNWSSPGGHGSGRGPYLNPNVTKRHRKSICDYTPSPYATTSVRSQKYSISSIAPIPRLSYSSQAFDGEYINNLKELRKVQTDIWKSNKFLVHNSKIIGLVFMSVSFTGLLVIEYILTNEHCKYFPLLGVAVILGIIGTIIFFVSRSEEAKLGNMQEFVGRASLGY